VASQFNRSVPTISKTSNKSKSASISKTLPPIPPRPSANVMAKYRQSLKSFAQATKDRAEEILKVKEAFVRKLNSKPE